MKNENDIFIVLESKGTSGLTIGRRVVKPGDTFRRSEWAYGEDGLESAVNGKRCKLEKQIESSGKKSDNESGEISESLARAKSELETIQKQVEGAKAGLQQANDELTSVNESLATARTELDTVLNQKTEANDELTSVNESLATARTELDTVLNQTTETGPTEG